MTNGTDLLEQHDLVRGGRLSDSTEARSTTSEVKLQGKHCQISKLQRVQNAACGLRVVHCHWWELDTSTHETALASHETTRSILNPAMSSVINPVLASPYITDLLEQSSLEWCIQPQTTTVHATVLQPIRWQNFLGIYFMTVEFSSIEMKTTCWAFPWKLWKWTEIVFIEFQWHITFLIGHNLKL